MKYRLDQVTNSSSSSYVCDICNHVESGWDMGLSDAEMYECENGHTICEDHINFSSNKEVAIVLLKKTIRYYENVTYYNAKEKKEKIDEIEELLKKVGYEEYDDFEEIFSDYELRNCLPAELCPICNHDHIRDSEALEFALKKIGITEDELKAEIRKQFKK